MRTKALTQKWNSNLWFCWYGGVHIAESKDPGSFVGTLHINATPLGRTTDISFISSFERNVVGEHTIARIALELSRIKQIACVPVKFGIMYSSLEKFDRHASITFTIDCCGNSVDPQTFTEKAERRVLSAVMAVSPGEDC